MAQSSLFPVPLSLPLGFTYEPEFITADEEHLLLDAIKSVTFSAYLYEGYEAKRRVHSYTKESGYPEFLVPFLKRAARFAGENFDEVEHALITEYSPGTQIGWHRDMPPYNKIIGISLGSAAPFRLRKETEKGWERLTFTVEPRSIYVMERDARYVWQHSIPPVLDWRYSITCRTGAKSVY
jgi:alkylated DNA repair dioxygenase AlkB